MAYFEIIPFTSKTMQYMQNPIKVPEAAEKTTAFDLANKTKARVKKEEINYD